MLADLAHMTVLLVDSLNTRFVRRDTGQVCAPLPRL
jgi:hypothetical protein